MSRLYYNKELPNLFQLAEILEDTCSLIQNQSLPWEVIQKQVTPESLNEILIRMYNHNMGRIAHHEILLLWFPDLLVSYDQLLQALMTEPGSLSVQWKIYIAIVVFNLNLIE